MVRVDLPPPDTPVTQTNCPKGKSTVIFCKLFPLALRTVTFLLLPTLRVLGTSILRRPAK